MNSAAGSVVVVLLGSLMLGAGTAYGGSPGGARNDGAPAQAGQSAASNCNLLPLSSVEEVTGIKFHEASENKALPPYDGAWGSSCEFSRMEPFPQGQPSRVDFTVYVEKSAAEAKTTFDKVAALATDHSKPALSGIGDSAYFSLADKEEAVIMVLKGRTHFQIRMTYPPDDKKVLQLAKVVAGRL